MQPRNPVRWRTELSCHLMNEQTKAQIRCLILAVSCLIFQFPQLTVDFGEARITSGVYGAAAQLRALNEHLLIP